MPDGLSGAFSGIIAHDTPAKMTEKTQTETEKATMLDTVRKKTCNDE